MKEEKTIETIELNNSLKKNGIPFERLINKSSHNNFLDIIQCKICFNILKNPYDCIKCGNSFCYNCISNMINQKKNCPFNCENTLIKPSSYYIISYLSKLKFYCKNKEFGCNEEISYENLDNHEKNCKFFFTKCPNLQCEKKVLWNLLENHLKLECPFSLIQCKNCNQNFNRNDYDEHLKNCINFKNYFSVIINKDNIESINNKKNEFEKFINNLPFINESSILIFMKMILYQFNLNNQILYNEIFNLKNEIKLISNGINNLNENNKTSLDNINKELNDLNLEIKEMNLQNIFSPIPKKQDNNDSLLSTGELEKNFLDFQERFSLKNKEEINEKNIKVNLHKKYESSKLPDNKFENIVYEEESENKNYVLKKTGKNKEKKRHYSKNFINYVSHKKSKIKNNIFDKLNHIIKMIHKIIFYISNPQDNSFPISSKNINDKNLDNTNKNINEKIQENLILKNND